MGYNTVVMFSNDQMHDAINNADKVMQHIRTASQGVEDDKRPYGIQVIPAYHADLAPIFIGGANRMQWLGDVPWYNSGNIPVILKAIAEKHGYKIAIRKRPPQ